MSAPEGLTDAEREALGSIAEHEDWCHGGRDCCGACEPDFGDCGIHARIAAVEAVITARVAAALREVADECLAKSRELRKAYRDWNHGRDPSRPRVREDLDTWAAAEGAAGNRINLRAKAIEGGA